MSSKNTELDKIDKFLEKHVLKKTLLRRGILLALAEAQGPLTQAELIDRLSKNNLKIDRVSVYRNLSSLKDAGIIHEVDSNNYVFCSHECDAHAHLLLFCQRCYRHQEIKDHAKVSQFMQTLSGFRFFGKKQPLFLKGVCSGCTINS